MLTSFSFYVPSVANDGQEALDVIQRSHTSEEGAQEFDVVLLDVEMPRVRPVHSSSSFAFASKIRS